jgi:anti-sigma regulatory factor (Ser/Thr protein kinase)
MEKRVLIRRWLGPDAEFIPIYDEASVSSARERVREAGSRLGVSKTLVENLALIASELTHNQLRYARQGYFRVNAVERDGVKGLETVAADLGPGLQQPILTGLGRSTAGGLGAGLEGVFRIADQVDVDTRGQEGLYVAARKFETPVAPAWEVAIAGRPFPGEVISGDDSVCLQSEAGFLAAVSDGLGHGPEARVASNRAIELLADNAQLPLDELLERISAGVKDIRGCAMGIARYRMETRTIECVLAGDVRAQLYNPEAARFFTATPFVVGDPIIRRRIRVEEAEVKPGAAFAMFTDGLESRTSLKDRRDLWRRPAIVIAQHLIQTHARPTDDALTLVARFIG